MWIRIRIHIVKSAGSGAAKNECGSTALGKISHDLGAGKETCTKLSFSVVGETGTLDCVAPDEQTFNYWLDGINTLLRYRTCHSNLVNPGPVGPETFFRNRTYLLRIRSR